MDTSLTWMRGRRDDVKTLLLRSDAQRRSRYCQYLSEQATTSFHPHLRRLSDFRTGETTHPRVPGWSILDLPAELRNLIWEHAFAGKLISLYRHNKHIAHALVDDNNSYDVTADEAVTLTTIQDTLDTLPNEWRNAKQSTYSTKLGVMASLQSCRTIYVEIIRLLYSSNTFIFLQNNGLRDFQGAILAERFRLIRSVHVHWQFRELSPIPGKWPWTDDIFSYDLRFLHEEFMPQLNCVSIFVQGPLHLGQTYKRILDIIKCRVVCPNRRLDHFVVRVPNAMSPSPWTLSIQELENLITVEDLEFSVVKPAETAAEAGDADVGADVGWRCGTMFLPMEDESLGRGKNMKRYIVWTQLPRGLTWPCRF
ncbi:hypothetical protein DE146DRAFT_225247 [Phaeosphaeria sp. MPI-PUGE-AT-0046c]|nr:hypothetical protein DE146DRAFT_225247 [Phaeosphaeria sp. MPI-PUGE-AT-0046c]